MGLAANSTPVRPLASRGGDPILITMQTHHLLLPSQNNPADHPPSSPPTSRHPDHISTPRHPGHISTPRHPGHISTPRHPDHISTPRHPGRPPTSRHPDRRRRFLPPQWRDPRISLLPVFARHSGAAPPRVVILAQPESPYWPLPLPLLLLLPLFVLRCHPERSFSQSYREKRSRRTPIPLAPPRPSTLSPQKHPLIAHSS